MTEQLLAVLVAAHEALAFRMSLDQPSFSGLPMCGLLPVNRARALVECRLEAVSMMGGGRSGEGRPNCQRPPSLQGPTTEGLRNRVCCPGYSERPVLSVDRKHSSASR